MRAIVYLSYEVFEWFHMRDDKSYFNSCLFYLRPVSSKIVVGSVGNFRRVLFPVGCGVRHAKYTTDVSRSKPAFLVVMSAVQLPSFVLKIKNNKNC